MNARTFTHSDLMDVEDSLQGAYGLAVDARAIGAGLYDLIVEQGEEAIVAFGMIPHWAIQTAEKATREKVISICAEQAGMPIEDFRPYVDEQKLKDTVQPIIHEVTLAIYAAAKNRGMLVV